MIETPSRALSTNRDSGLAKKRIELFEELMLFQKKVFLICLGFSRNATDAQDLAQDVYLRAYKNIGNLSEPSLAKVWLFRIARNTCLNFRKKHRREICLQPIICAPDAICGWAVPAWMFHWQELIAPCCRGGQAL